MLRLARGAGIVLVGLSVLSVAWAAEGEKEKAKPASKAPATRAETPPVASQEAVRRALDSPVTLEFTETPLGDVVDFLRDATRVQIRVDKKALEDMGVATDVPITFNQRGLRFRLALDLLLRDLDLTWTVQDQVLLITTAEAADELQETQVYDVREMVVAKDEKGQPANDFDQLVDLITTTVEPTTWDEVGGPGSIAPYEMDGTAVIVIRQTWRTQEKVQRLLEDIRAARKGKPGEGIPRRLHSASQPAPCPVCQQRQREEAAQAKPPQQPTGGIGGKGMF